MVVTGAGGMVGSYVNGIFKNHDLVLTDRIEGFDYLDVRDPSAVMNFMEVLKLMLLFLNFLVED